MVFRRTARRYLEHFNVTTLLPSPDAVAVRVILPDGAVDLSIATPTLKGVSLAGLKRFATRIIRVVHGGQNRALVQHYW